MSHSQNDLKEITKLYARLKDLRATQALAEHFYAEATLYVGTSGSQRSIAFPVSTAAEWIDNQIATTEASLRTYGFEP